MRKALMFALGACIPLLLAATSGGFPSKPKFQEVTTAGTITVKGVTAGACGGNTAICLPNSGAVRGLNTLGQPKGLLWMGSDDSVHLGSSSSPMTVESTGVVVGSGMTLSGMIVVERTSDEAFRIGGGATSSSNPYMTFYAPGGPRIGYLQAFSAGGLRLASQISGGPIEFVTAGGVGAVTVNGSQVCTENGTGCPVLSGSVTVDFGSMAAGVSSQTNINISGVTTSMACSVNSSIWTAGLLPFCNISTANQVNVGFVNYSNGAIDPASATFNVRVAK